VDPLADVSAGEYARQARQTLREIVARESVLHESEQRRHLPIVSGGTGLYLRALLEGLFPGPQRSEELRINLRARVTGGGPELFHLFLGRLPPSGGSRIHANDVPKVIRAIEVCLASRQSSPHSW